MVPPLRASNEGLPRPRVARAQGDHQLPPTPLLQKQPHSHLLPFDPGPAKRLDDFAGQHFRHFHQRKSIHYFDQQAQ